MQQDFKNQLHNTLELWRKKGQRFMDEVVSEKLKETKMDLRRKLAQQGVAENWSALVDLVSEVLPEIAPTMANIIIPKTEPLAHWLNLQIKEWQPYKIETTVAPQSHLLNKNHWESSSWVAMAEQTGRWLLEKHAPPGDMKIKVKKVELEVVGPGPRDNTASSAVNDTINGALDCTVRCELSPEEFESSMAELLKQGEVLLFIPIMILLENDVLLSQVNFHFELQWTPLLK